MPSSPQLPELCLHTQLLVCGEVDDGAVWSDNGGAVINFPYSLHQMPL